MKVKELIEELEKCDPNHLVVVDGYEGDYDDCFLYFVKLDLNTSSALYVGSHTEGNEVDAIVISRYEED